MSRSGCRPRARQPQQSTLIGEQHTLERFKDLGDKLSSSATRVAVSDKEGAGVVVVKAGGAVKSAGQAAGQLTDRASAAAKREAIEQMRDMLAQAAKTLQARPTSNRPVTITARVDLMLTSLQPETVVDDQTELRHTAKRLTAPAEPTDADPGDVPASS